MTVNAALVGKEPDFLAEEVSLVFFEGELVTNLRPCVTIHMVTLVAPRIDLTKGMIHYRLDVIHG